MLGRSTANKYSFKDGLRAFTKMYTVLSLQILLETNILFSHLETLPARYKRIHINRHIFAAVTYKKTQFEYHLICSRPSCQSWWWILALLLFAVNQADHHLGQRDWFHEVHV